MSLMQVGHYLQLKTSKLHYLSLDCLFYSLISITIITSHLSIFKGLSFSFLHINPCDMLIFGF